MAPRRVHKKAPPRPGRPATGLEPTLADARRARGERRRQLEAQDRRDELGRAGMIEDEDDARAWRLRRRQIQAAAVAGTLVIDTFDELGPVGGGDRSRVHFQLELVRCGRCPKLHGPYWYAYQHVGPKLRKVYVGRTLNVAKARRALADKYG